MPTSPYMDRAVVYMFHVEKHNKKEVVSLLDKITKNQEGMMNLAEQFRDEGRREGVTKDKIEGKRETARNMIKYGASLDLVEKSTGLSQKQVKTLNKDKF